MTTCPKCASVDIVLGADMKIINDLRTKLSDALFRAEAAESKLAEAARLAQDSAGAAMEAVAAPSAAERAVERIKKHCGMRAMYDPPSEFSKGVTLHAKEVLRIIEQEASRDR